MPIELDEKTALVVIDLQSGIVAMAGAETMSGVVANSARLAHAFRAAGKDVVLVNVAGTAPGRTHRNPAGGARALPAEATVLLDELGHHENDIAVTKTTLGAFLSTDLDAQLRARGVTQIVLTGVSTTSGVESTARSAYELGYNVAFVTDAMLDTNPEAHDASIAHQFPKLGEIGTSDEVLAALAGLAGL